MNVKKFSREELARIFEVSPELLSAGEPNTNGHFSVLREREFEAQWREIARAFAIPERLMRIDPPRF